MLNLYLVQDQSGLFLLRHRKGEKRIWKYEQERKRSFSFAKKYIRRGRTMLQQILAICGGISIIGGAGAVIYKVIHPAFKFKNRVEKLEEHSEKDYKRLEVLEEMQKQQSKCLAAMLNHQITGNGIENMKKIRDELLESIIDK